MPHDPSFSPDALYGSKSWLAQRLGMTKDNLSRRLKTLIDEGLPDRDPITNLWLKADVDAYVENRRKIVLLSQEPPSSHGEINTDAL